MLVQVHTARFLLIVADKEVSSLVFSSIIFLLLFLPVTLILYYLVGKPFRNITLLAASLLFYAWGEGEYLLLMLVSIGMNYLIGVMLDRAGSQQGRRNYLIIGLVLNLLMFGFFKYANMLVSTFASLIPGLESTDILSTPIHLPIGISFFTFQAMSYIIDVYRNETRPQKNPFYLGLYISSFPQLIAGPIVRYNQVADQITSRTHSFTMFAGGIERFIYGLSKKVLIANPMAAMADRIFAADYTQLSPELAWLGLICYMLQIYFDFSGYSDMAIGLGRMFGFKFPENFNYPYISRSIQEFWRRWHISLSGWFRDYLYFPLGGNRGSNAETYRNLFTVFILCGLWHGASWNYLLWGLYHGIFLALERKILKNWLSGCSRITGHLYFTFVLLNSWVLFRIEDLSAEVDYLKALYFMNDPIDSSVNVGIQIHIDMFFVFILVMGFLFSMPVLQYLKKLSSRRVDWSQIGSGAGAVLRTVKYAGLFCLFYISLSFLTVNSYNPFIYFRF